MKSILREKFKNPEEARLWAEFIALAPFVFQVSRCLRNFGILKILSDSQAGVSFAEIRSKTELSEYSLSVIMDGGESCGLLYAEQKKYFLTPSGNFVENDKLTNVNMNFANDVCYQGLFSLEESLRNNSPEGLKVFGEWSTIYEGLTQLPDQSLKSWLDFDHFYSDDVFPRVLPIVLEDAPKTILDVGGNTGKFSMLAAKADTNLSITILDHPAQLELARKNMLEQGLQDRVHGLPFNLLDHSLAFPRGFDLIWMSQFLDCFSKQDILALLKRAHAAMSESSQLFILETFTDRQRYEGGKFCLDMTSLYFTCMANGNSRMYRASEFLELLTEAKLRVVEEYDNIRLSHTLLKCVRN